MDTIDINIFKLAENYFERVNTEPKSRIVGTAINAMSYEFEDKDVALGAANELLSLVHDYGLEYVEIKCMVLKDMFFITIEQLDADEIEEELESLRN